MSVYIQRFSFHNHVQHCSVESLKTLVAFRGPDVNPISAEGTPLDVAGVNIHDGNDRMLSVNFAIPGIPGLC